MNPRTDEHMRRLLEQVQDGQPVMDAGQAADAVVARLKPETDEAAEYLREWAIRVFVDCLLFGGAG